MKTLLVSFGSNLGDRETQIRQAADLLAKRIGTLKALSPCYESEPLGFESSHPFLDAAAVYETQLMPEELLQNAEEVERELGRTQKSVDGEYHDRPIDIDLLALDDMVVQTERLTLPHPRLTGRRFVLCPLCDVAPDAIHPISGRTYRELLDRLNTLHISKIWHASEEMVEALNRLMPQLVTYYAPYTFGMLANLIDNPTTYLYVGRDEDNVIRATYTLCITPSPTGRKAWIEDVVVDESCRHRGYGRQLIEHGVERARELGAKSVNLTSRPARASANRLYQSLGFEQRETNVYRLNL